MRDIKWNLCCNVFIKCDLATYPCGHAVGVWVAVVVVEDHDGEQDAAGHHPHDEVEVRSCSKTTASAV